MAQGAQTAKQLAQLAAQTAATTLGTCLSVDFTNLLAVVDVGGAAQSMPWVGSAPYKGDRVRIMTAGGQPACFAQYGHPLGTVVAVASSLATVTGDDGQTYQYPYPSGVTLAAGNRVALDHALRVVVELISAEPPGSLYVQQSGAPGPTKQSRTFTPTDSGNYTSGAYSTQYVEISTTRYGFYWFGTQIADSIPDTATITRAIVTLSEVWDEVPGAASLMQLHTDSSASHGGSQPTLTGAGVSVSNSGTFDISSMVAALVTGSAFGLGFPGGATHGWRRFDTFLASGAITIDWTS